jgi:hypothetical protein
MPVAGSAGAGKTLLGLQYLVASARGYGDPGVLVTFEESAAKATDDVRSLALTSTANEYPFLISEVGFTVLPITSSTLDQGPADHHPGDRAWSRGRDEHGERLVDGAPGGGGQR